jgi:hypothetical protein
VWDYCATSVAAIRRHTALDIPELRGRVPVEYVHGYTPDISAYALFDWYEYVYFYEPTAEIPHERKVLGRWLGVAESSTDIMACYVLTGTGKVVV